MRPGPICQRQAKPLFRFRLLQVFCYAILFGLLGHSIHEARAAIDIHCKNVSSVIYCASDQAASSQFKQIIAGLRSEPDIVVYPADIAFKQVLAYRRISRRLADKVAMADSQIAVIYPDIGEPYRSIFTRIIAGIQARAKSKVVSYAVGKGWNQERLISELRNQKVRVVIALGRQGMKTANTLDKDFDVVIGGVVSIPESEAKDMPVLSLSPAPALLFSRLLNLVPTVRRVFVVYDPRQNSWLIRLARTAAREQGLKLVAYRAEDLKSAVRIYQKILASADGHRDALWLPQDATTVDGNTVLPLVLEKSWNRSIPVFSSSFSHVKRGVLFSFYPDNLGLGRSLANSALGYINGAGAIHGVVPLRNVLTAVNLRTAKHLGLNFSSEQRRGFDLVFTGQ